MRFSLLLAASVLASSCATSEPATEDIVRHSTVSVTSCKGAVKEQHGCRGADGKFVQSVCCTPVGELAVALSEPGVLVAPPEAIGDDPEDPLTDEFFFDVRLVPRKDPAALIAPAATRLDEALALESFQEGFVKLVAGLLDGNTEEFEVTYNDVILWASVDDVAERLVRSLTEEARQEELRALVEQVADTAIRFGGEDSGAELIVHETIILVPEAPASHALVIGLDAFDG